MRALFPCALLLLVACDGGDPAGGIACGDALTCTGREVCVRESAPADCQALDGDSDASCPEGTTETMCGGAGYPCCCGPTPEPTWTCVVPDGCGGEPTCECVPCEDGKQCTSVGSETSGVFSCDDPPAP
jgi:hypothetical protein